MKRSIYHIILSLIIFMVSSSWASATTELPTKGVWTNGKLENNITVNLTGDVTVQGRILIPNGITLTINANGAERLIKWVPKDNAYEHRWRMFHIESGGKLVITGTEGARIIIDGGAQLSRDPETGIITMTGGTAIRQVAILNQGALDLDYVTIRNVYNNESNQGAAIRISTQVDGSTNYRNFETTLSYCIIENCVSGHGPALLMHNQYTDTKHPSSQTASYQKNTATNCAVSLFNTTIQHCYSSAANEGGIIRTWGNAVGNLLLGKCIIKENRSEGSAGAVYWNAKGHKDTKLTLRGSTFKDNVAWDRGGAMMLESDFEFEAADDGTINTISGNILTDLDYGRGGGIIITSYTGKNYTATAETVFDFNFNDKVQIINNKAAKGAGVCLDLHTYELWEGFKPSSSSKIKVNLNFDGAVISNNIATGDGGGVRLYNNTSASGNHGNASQYITVNVNLNKGEFADNQAEKGGGLYLYKANVAHNSAKATSVQLLRNSAKVNGGAIYIDGSPTVNLPKTVIQNNSAQTGSGGGIYITGGGLTIKNPTIQNNSAKDGGAIYITGNNAGFTSTGSENVQITQNTASGDGGAIYVNGGSITIANPTDIENNTAANDGGGFYVNNGNIHLNGITTLTANTATGNGGAIALHNGTFSFANGSEIKDNQATGNGGGLYVSNSSEVSIDCIGGAYVNNKANFGGGLYASGPITLQFAADLLDNKAVNGGGLYLENGIDMTFGVNTNDLKLSGLIVGNEATGDGTQGVGGGVYLKEGKLRFAVDDNFKDLGIYNNFASYEAADIYASGSSTTVYLPNVTGMNLSGFDVFGNDLYWIEDFHEKRYEEALRNNENIEDMTVKFGTNKTLTLTDEQCLDLGYDFVYVTLVPIGLDPSDNAAVTIAYPSKTDGTPTFYRKVLLVGTKEKVVGLPSHYWQFDVTPWSFTYDLPEVYNPAHATTTNESNKQRKDYIYIKRDVNQRIEITFGQSDSKKSLGTSDAIKTNVMRTTRMVPAN